MRCYPLGTGGQPRVVQLGRKRLEQRQQDAQQGQRAAFVNLGAVVFALPHCLSEKRVTDPAGRGRSSRRALGGAERAPPSAHHRAWRSASAPSPPFSLCTAQCKPRVTEKKQREVALDASVERGSQPGSDRRRRLHCSSNAINVSRQWSQSNRSRRWSTWLSCARAPVGPWGHGCIRVRPL